METTHTHWKVLVNPLYIGAYCVQSDLTVKILKVTRELVKGEGGKSEECTVAHLEGQKPFILNRTNCKTITRLYNTPFIEEWAGKLITIYPTTTKVAGDTVECLRVRSTKPDAIVVDYTAQIESLRNCTTIEQLAAEYKALSKDAQIATVTVKDEMKQKLTPVTA